MKLIMAAATLLSLIVPGTSAKCPADAPAPRGVVCIVNPTGHIAYGRQIHGLYTKDADVVVERTDAACQRETL